MDKKVCGVMPILSFLAMVLLLCSGIVFFFCMYRALEILEVIQRELGVPYPSIAVFKMVAVVLCFALLLLVAYNLCYSVFGDSERNSYLVRAGPSFLLIVLLVLLQLLFLLVLTTMTIGWLITDLMLQGAEAPPAEEEPPVTEDVRKIGGSAHGDEFGYNQGEAPADYYDGQGLPRETFAYIGASYGPYKYHVQDGDKEEETFILTQDGSIQRQRRGAMDASYVHPYYGPAMFVNETAHHKYHDITDELMGLMKLRRTRIHGGKRGISKRQDEEDETEGGEDEDGGDEDANGTNITDLYWEDYSPELAATGSRLFQIAIITNTLIVIFLGMFIMIRVYNFQYMYVDSCVMDSYDDNCCTTSSHSTRTDCCD